MNGISHTNSRLTPLKCSTISVAVVRSRARRIRVNMRRVNVLRAFAQRLFGHMTVNKAACYPSLCTLASKLGKGSFLHEIALRVDKFGFTEVRKVDFAMKRE